MKYELTFKTPDALAQLGDPKDWKGFTAVKAVFNKYVEHDEHITIEFDTITGTATAVEL